LEHVQKPELILKHCKRLLKPSGVLFVSTLNRSPKAYAFAILAAEYIFRLLPKQTHDYDKFIKPSELNAMALSFQLNRRDMSGMNYNPFTRKASLCEDVGVNYLMAFEK
jgi:2-polyprenyl-6-hydroxyphenyl methylase/3-demethylubiquinone-9 3-methyltransferase